MKRCKYCGAIRTENGCPNRTCIAYTEQDVTQVTSKKRKTKKADVDNVDIVETDIKR